MPLYDYECGACGNVTEHYKNMDDEEPEACPECGGIARRTITTRYYAHSDVTDYVEWNLGEQPVRINSRQQRRELMKKADVYEKYGKGWI